jgi:zona occludens toxin (predicted ATPase)
MANAKLKSLQAARELIAVRLGESSHDEPEPVRSSSDVEPLTKQTPATKQAITKPEFTNAENAVRVLRDSGPDQPLTATQIAHRLITKFGIPDPGGRALESRIYTALGRRPDLFKKAGNGKWALVEHGKEWIT